MSRSPPKPDLAEADRRTALKCTANEDSSRFGPFSPDSVYLGDSEEEYLAKKPMVVPDSVGPEDWGILLEDRHGAAQDSGAFQCVAWDDSTGEEACSANASFNIKWIETGPVVLKHEASEAEIQPQAQPEHSGIYSCCAHNAFGQACSSQKFTFSIADESFARVVLAPQDMVVARNEEAMFHCQFSTQPPATLQWIFDETPITNHSRPPHLRRAMVFASGSLLLTQVRPCNAGVYRCIGQGQRGPPIVLEATLHPAEIAALGRDCRPLSHGCSQLAVRSVWPARPTPGSSGPSVCSFRANSPLGFGGGTGASCGIRSVLYPVERIGGARKSQSAGTRVALPVRNGEFASPGCKWPFVSAVVVLCLG
ncbi:hypothetical protein CB1_068050013 [Camelus ferus]|nr:hypothetical protein CB1_068050013 [Camelus ferus]